MATARLPDPGGDGAPRGIVTPGGRRRVTAAAAVLAACLAGCGGHQGQGGGVGGTLPAGRCPLTGGPAPRGEVPGRPALAVKVENLPQARPQWGLAAADLVYEEPVEGGVTRFVVVYQCLDAGRIEPVRSARIVDPDIVRQLGAHPLFAYAGGIDPAVAAVRSSPLVDVGVSRAPSAYRRDPGRAAPHNLVTSTAALYAARAAAAGGDTPPAPVFAYGPLPAGAGRAHGVRVHYTYSDLAWTWNPAGRWDRSYAGGGPAATAEGGTVSATNVVVMKVNMYPSRYVEDPNGVRENLLGLTGSGPAQVFRDGAVIDGRWDRPNLGTVTRYLDGAGRDIALEAGTTWVELVPDTVAVASIP